MAAPVRAHRTTPAELARAIGAALGLLALAVGAPLLLYALVGNPLPTTLPSGEEFRRAVTGDIADTTLIKAAALLAWLLWAQLVVALPVEVIAALRDRDAHRVPVLAPIQAFVARLAASAVVLVSAFAARPAPATEPRAPIPITAHVERSAPVSPPPAPSASAAPPTSTAAEAPTYVVAHLDTLWGIAERTLSDPYRWSEIEALNAGRPQPDGQALQPGGALLPGWVLVLPSDATIDPPPPAVPDAGVVTVQPGDSLWAIAARTLGDPHRWPEIDALNRGRPQPDGQTLTDPDLILPGWQLAVPAAPLVAAPPPPPQPPLPEPDDAVPAPTPTVPPPDPTGQPSPRDHRAAPRPNPETAAPADNGEHADDDPAARPPLAAILGVSGLLAAGVVAMLARLRAVQQRLRPPGRRLPTPTTARADTEHHVRAAAAASPAEWLAAANRALTGALRQRRTPTPAFVAARLGREHLELLLAEPAPPDAPAPFQATPDGWMWRLPRRIRVDQLAGIAGTPSIPALPALATIGHTDDGPLLLNLEACGLVAASGTPPAIDALLRGVALELAVSPAADWLDVALVADPSLLADPDRPEPLDVPALTGQRLRVLTDITDAVTLAEATARSTSRALDDAGQITTLAARADGQPADAWAPTVLILPATPDPDTRSRLEASTGPGRGVAVIAGGSWPDAPWAIHVADNRVTIPRLGATAWLDDDLTQQRLEPEPAAAVTDLLENARNNTEQAVTDPQQAFAPIDSAPPDDAPSAGASRHPATFDEAALDVEVRVLGDIEVTGLTQPLGGIETELLVYLATHDRPTTADKAMTALWPNARPSDQRWANVLNLVRKSLGASRDGELHLPHHRGSRRLALGSRVRCDLDRVRDRLRSAEHADPTQRRQLLTDAVSFVRGAPFTPPPTRRGGYEWAYSEGIYYFAESLSIDCTHALARCHLEEGNPDAALAAAARGLAVTPNAEILYQDRMDAHHTLGNPQAVETEMHTLIEANDILDPCEQLDPETLRRYEEYTRRPYNAAASHRRAARSS
ncbi:MAG: LysM peptidoglycan-binding domain-containing protein [Acidimicrobiia bacterium]